MLVRILFLLVSLASLSALTPARAESVLRVKANAEFANLDPGANIDFYSRGVLNVVLEGLVAYREDTSIGLMLADALEVSADGRRYLFTLRDGVTFHNGAPLDAEAVIFAWRRYLDPAGGWRCLPQFDGGAGAKVLRLSAPDPKSVLFELEKPNPAFLEQMARLDCVAAGIFQRDSVDANGRWVRPVGTGPFKLGEARRGEYLELLKFDAYQSRPEPRDGMTGGKTPLVDKVRLTNLPMDRIPEALFGGRLDLDPEFSMSAVEAFLNHPDFTVNAQPSMELTGLLFQTQDPVLSDPRMRRAVLLGMNREAMARQVNYGRIGAVHSPIPSNSPYSGAAQKTALPYDPVEAKRLLAEIGYDGRPLKMSVSRRYMTVYLAAILTQNMMGEIGVPIELEEMDWDLLFKRYAKGDYQMMMFQYSARIDPALSFEMLTGSKAAQPHKVWDDPAAIQLVQQAIGSGDPVLRRSLLDQLQQRFVADLPMIPLWNSPDLAVHHNRVKGFEPWVARIPRYWGVRIE